MSESMMMSLAFEGRAVRFVGTPERPEWVASDVCGVLGLKNVTRALAGLRQNEKRDVTASNVPLSGQEIKVINEPGLYRLIFKSKKAEAERFKDWVFHEVLPSIRRTGAFGLSSELTAARAQVVALLEISAKQASALASGLARRGHQLRVEERAIGAISRGQKLLLPDAGPIRTVVRAPRRRRTGSAL